jgi:hypothetical protein
MAVVTALLDEMGERSSHEHYALGGDPVFLHEGYIVFTYLMPTKTRYP